LYRKYKKGIKLITIPSSLFLIYLILKNIYIYGFYYIGKNGILLFLYNDYLTSIAVIVAHIIVLLCMDKSSSNVGYYTFIIPSFILFFAIPYINLIFNFNNKSENVLLGIYLYLIIYCILLNTYVLSTLECIDSKNISNKSFICLLLFTLLIYIIVFIIPLIYIIYRLLFLDLKTVELIRFDIGFFSIIQFIITFVLIYSSFEEKFILYFLLITCTVVAGIPLTYYMIIYPTFRFSIIAVIIFNFSGIAVGNSTVTNGKVSSRYPEPNNNEKPKENISKEMHPSKLMKKLSIERGQLYDDFHSDSYRWWNGNRFMTDRGKEILDVQKDSLGNEILIFEDRWFTGTCKEYHSNNPNDVNYHKIIIDDGFGNSKKEYN